MIFRCGLKEMLSYSGKTSHSISSSGNDDMPFYLANNKHISYMEGSVSGQFGEQYGLNGGWISEDEKLSLMFNRDLNSILEE